MEATDVTVSSCFLPSGFDQQIDRGQALADAAISRLPGVNRTIQKAVRDNAKASSTFKDVSATYNDAMGTVSQLESLVDSMEVTSSHQHVHQAPPLVNSGADAILFSREPLDLCLPTLLC